MLRYVRLLPRIRIQDDGVCPSRAEYARERAPSCAPGVRGRVLMAPNSKRGTQPDRKSARRVFSQPVNSMGKNKKAAGGARVWNSAGASCGGSQILLGCLSSFIVAFIVLFGFTFRSNSQAVENEAEVKIYGYEIVRELDHDPLAFTQGFLYAGNGTFYESTGLNGQSTVREVDELTGKVRRIYRLNRREFGEGLTLWNDRLYQVTWRNQKVFIYDRKTLALKGQATHPMKDGWGLTSSDQYVIGSDGTSRLYFLQPESFKEVKVLTVKDSDKDVGWLNELEFVHGEIWANVWQSECIARISPDDGRVTGWILLQGLRSSLNDRGARNMDVLNGIAWDQDEDRIYVTGKMWPKVFEIKLLDKSHEASLDNARTICNIGREGFTF